MPTPQTYSKNPAIQAAIVAALAAQTKTDTKA